MDWETAVQRGEMLELKRAERDARQRADAAWAALMQAKINGTYTERMSADYWMGPFKDFADTQAAIMGLQPIADETIRRVAGVKGGA